MSKIGRNWLLGISWLGAAFRFNSLFTNHFHSDEALFASWAKHIAVWRDPLLFSQPVDKPPLLFFLQALFFPLLRAEEFTARQPGFIASFLLIPMVGLLAWQLFGDEKRALIAASFVALSPMAIQFSGTAFLDAPLTLCMTTSLYLISRSSRGRPASVDQIAAPLSGVCFGLGLATKLQAWLFFPLVLGTALLVGWDRRRWRGWLAGFLPVVLLLLAWDLARPGDGPLWSLQLSNIGGFRVIWSWELGRRFWQWLALWRLLLAGPAMILLLLALIMRALSALPLLSLSRVSMGLTIGGYRRNSGATSRPGQHPSATDVDLLLILFVAAYGMMHWLVAIPAWDRYLLPLVPLAAVISAGPAAKLLEVANTRKSCLPQRLGQIGTWSMAIILLILMLAQIPWALKARVARFPIGGRPDADHGAAEVALELADSPYGTVLYDHWYSWQWRYHLFDSRVYVSWFAHPADLARDLLAFGDDGNARYLSLPVGLEDGPLRRAIASVGFQLIEEARSDEWRMILFRILPQGETT